MAGLSMGSMQTSMTVCRYSQLFGWEGLFSGFMHNFIGEDPDNSYLEIMKEKEFQEKQHLFSGLWEGRMSSGIFYGGRCFL